MDIKDGEKHEHDHRVIHDFETEGAYIKYMACFNVAKGPWRTFNLCYIALVVSYLTFLLALSAIAAVLFIGNKKLFLETLHWFTLILLLEIFMYLRRVSGVDKALEAIRCGFFTYKSERPDERYATLKAKRVRRVRRSSTIFIWLVIAVGIAFNFSKVIGGDNGAKTVVNTKLPLLLYLPFDSRSGLGNFFAYLMNEIAIFYVALITVYSIEVFVSMLEQLIAQFEILNLSIRNVHNRARVIYAKEKDIEKCSWEELYEQAEFQKCVLYCLHENIRHHHCLLRFVGNIKKFTRWFFLILVLTAVIHQATLLFIVFEFQGIAEAGTFFALFTTELSFVFIVCFYGEMLSKSSGDIFIALWSTPWWNFDHRNKSTLFIMMTNTLRPIVLKAAFINFGMSLETFSTITNTAYQVLNLARNVH